MQQQLALEEQNVPKGEQREQLRTAQAAAERELGDLYAQAERAEQAWGVERAKLEKYCRDLAELCSRVAQQETRVPDGRRLIFAVGRDYRPVADA